MGEEPAKVRMPEAAEQAGDPLAPVEVGGVRVAPAIAARVVAAMDGGPVKDGALRGHRAEDRQDNADGRPSPERTVPISRW